MAQPAHFVGSVVEVVISTPISKAVALGKRKASEAFASSSATHTFSVSSVDSDSSEGEEDNGSEFEGNESVEDEAEQSPLPSGSQTPSKRLYRCIHVGCTKLYSKPSRLAEHQRSHTGERPYTCLKCSKSYLRESHLQAHARSHLSVSDRPLACNEENCLKRFWTTQHLNVHVASVHRGEKPFGCTENGCNEQFAKHNQLRRHVADVHSPPGTKPYQCTEQGCKKSFPTNQKLRKHSKVHEGNRYACIDSSCATTNSSGASSPSYFSTWTSLQAHIRECHPPTCPHLECGGRTFTSHKGLKGHLKVHEQKQVEDALEQAVGDAERPTKRRRGGEVGRDWLCEVDGCVKTFKSKKALTTHHNITHLGRRDHICLHPGCRQTFGYKHLLQRHTTKMHTAGHSSSAAAPDSTDDEAQPSSIGWITGASYSSSSAHRNTRRPLVPCPWPDQFGDDNEGQNLAHDKKQKDTAIIARCAYVFNRAYDLRRHLKAEHSLELTKDEVDSWVKDWRECHSSAL